MQTFKRASFYFVAHADDWQLFMSPEIDQDIADKECKVVIVHTTAGDAGRDANFWMARELAAIDSLLFRLSTDDRVNHEEEDVGIDNKMIFRLSANNCLCYFLRLPDGAHDGKGFGEYRYQSLEKFQKGIITNLSSVNDKSVYVEWNDLVGTIDSIIKRELSFIQAESINDIILNFPESDLTLNPNGHNDHYLTSILVQSTNAYNKYKKRAFVDYNIINREELLTDEELFWKVGMFCVYHQSLYKRYGHSTIAEDKSFIPWCFRKSCYRDL